MKHRMQVEQDYTGKVIPLDDVSGTLVFVLSNGRQLYIKIREQEPGMMTIRSDSGLAILPDATNGVRLQPLGG